MEEECEKIGEHCLGKKSCECTKTGHKAWRCLYPVQNALWKTSTLKEVLINHIVTIIHTKAIRQHPSPVLIQWAPVQRCHHDRQRQCKASTAQSSPPLYHHNTVSNVQPQWPIFNTWQIIITKGISSFRVAGWLQWSSVINSEPFWKGQKFGFIRWTSILYMDLLCFCQHYHLMNLWKHTVNLHRIPWHVGAHFTAKCAARNLYLLNLLVLQCTLFSEENLPNGTMKLITDNSVMKSAGRPHPRNIGCFEQGTIIRCCFSHSLNINIWNKWEKWITVFVNTQNNNICIIFAVFITSYSADLEVLVPKKEILTLITQ